MGVRRSLGDDTKLTFELSNAAPPSTQAALKAARDRSGEPSVVEALRDLDPGPERYPGDSIMELSEALAAASTAVSGEVSRRDTASKCCVCLEKDRDVVFMPCFHLVACWDCSKRMCECPICRKNIGQKRRVYN